MGTTHFLGQGHQWDLVVVVQSPVLQVAGNRTEAYGSYLGLERMGLARSRNTPALSCEVAWSAQPTSFPRAPFPHMRSPPAWNLIFEGCWTQGGQSSALTPLTWLQGPQGRGACPTFFISGFVSIFPCSALGSKRYLHWRKVGNIKLPPGFSDHRVLI